MRDYKINAPDLAEAMDVQAEGISANAKMMIIAAAFLVVTVGLILIQPSRATQQSAEIDQPIVAPTATLAANVKPAAANFEVETGADVTRSNTSLLSLNEPALNQSVSEMLTQPIRLQGEQHDLRAITREVLSHFNYDAAKDDELQRVLVQALAERQSNAYIDALLNTAASRGDYAIPPALQLSSGRLNTDALLQELAGHSNQ